MPTQAPPQRGELLLGNLAKPEMVKGNMIAAHLNWVREQLNRKDPRAADLTPFWEVLPPLNAEHLKTGVLAGDWYSFSDMVEVDRAIVTMFGKGDLAILETLGEYSADRNVPVSSLVGDAHRYFHLHARMHTRFQNYGVSEYHPQFGGGSMTFTGYTAYSPIFCRSGIGFFRRVLQRFGYDSVAVRETVCTCDGGGRCVFEMTWTGEPVSIG